MLKLISAVTQGKQIMPVSPYAFAKIKKVVQILDVARDTFDKLAYRESLRFLINSL